MEGIVFFCDLDGTLFSSAHRSNGDVAMETLDGKPHGFMPEAVADALKRLCKRVRVVPVTSRTEAQFKRLKFPEGIEFPHALVANGATLIVNGEADGEWKRVYDDLYAPYEEALNGLYEELKEEYRIRRADGRFLYLVFADRAEADVFLQRRLPEGLVGQRVGRKAYLYPQSADKGGAVQRWKEKFGCRYAIAAGDGETELTMLENADFAIAPKSLEEKLKKTENTAFYEGEDFPSFVAKQAEKRL